MEALNRLGRSFLVPGGGQRQRQRHCSAEPRRPHSWPSYGCFDRSESPACLLYPFPVWCRSSSIQTYPTPPVDAGIHFALMAPRHGLGRVRHIYAPHSRRHSSLAGAIAGTFNIPNRTTPRARKLCTTYSLLLLLFSITTPRDFYTSGWFLPPLSWTSANIFSSLTVLEIINVARARWPSEPEMIGMLSAARSLVALVIKNCGVRHVRYGAQIHGFDLPQLVTLDLYRANGMTSLVRALRNASTPALRCLTVRGFDSADLRLLHTNLQGFSDIQQLRIKCNICSVFLRDDIIVILESLPEISLLDVDYDAGQFVSVLTDNPGYGTKLSLLAVADVDLAVMHAYVMCRSDHRNSALRLYLNTADEPIGRRGDAHASRHAETSSCSTTLYRIPFVNIINPLIQPTWDYCDPSLTRVPGIGIAKVSRTPHSESTSHLP